MAITLLKCRGVLMALLGGFLTSCGGEGTDQPVSHVAGERPAAPATPVFFSAAASTKEVMEALAAEFSRDTKATIQVNPGPSNGLANQILEGAPVDLFLSADRQWAMKIAEANWADTSKNLLSNQLVLIVPRGNPAEVRQPQDLLSDRVTRVSLAGEKVPAGKYADQALAKLNLLDMLVSRNKIARAQDVRSAVTFVERGEAEAGIVYSTDAVNASNVEVAHEFDRTLHEDIVYVLVLLRRGAANPAAKSFFEFLQSDGANVVYEKAGFRRWE